MIVTNEHEANNNKMLENFLSCMYMPQTCETYYKDEKVVVVRF